MDQLVDDDIWRPADKYFETHGMISHQLSSYNNFISKLIGQIIDENGTVEIEVENKKENKKEIKMTISFGDIIFTSPKYTEIDGIQRLIFPSEAILRGMTYSSNLYCTITVNDKSGGDRIHKNVLIGSIPVMIKSELCNTTKDNITPEILRYNLENENDIGGYFIVNGSKKVIISRERSAFNRIYVFSNHRLKFSIYSEVRSGSADGSHTTTTQVRMYKNMRIYAIIPYAQEPIPIGILFKALGAVSEKEIIEKIISDTSDHEIVDKLLLSIEHSFPCKTQLDAIIFIGKKSNRKHFKTEEGGKTSKKVIDMEQTILAAKKLLEKELFPHIGTDLKAKQYYLGLMIKKFLEVMLKRRVAEDRDHYMNKRIDDPGSMLANLFYGAFKRLRLDLKYTCEKGFKSGQSIIGLLKSKIITISFNSSLATGNWGGFKGTPKQNGISQQYDEFNVLSSLSCLRKLHCPLGEDGGKVTAARRLHPSSYGFVCPAETPEGGQCGLVKTLALSATVAIGAPMISLIELIQGLGIINFDSDKILSSTKIFVNGKWIGCTDKPEYIVSTIRDFRRNGNLNPETSIVYDKKFEEIKFSTDTGRLIRPLFIVKDGNLLFKKEHLDMEFSNIIEAGLIEYLDPEEQDSPNTFIVNKPSDLLKMSGEIRLKVTHCELHSSFIFGVGASIIPFSDHNQSPRNTYQASMGKQGIGIPGGLNYRYKMTETFHVLCYPQRPLCETKGSAYFDFSALPAGQNAIVGIISGDYSNQEDSVAINKASVERGLFRSEHHEHFSAEIMKHKNQKLDIPEGNIQFLSTTDGDIFQRLKMTQNNMLWAHNKNDPVPRGVIKIGSFVSKGDILIGIVKLPSGSSDDKQINMSVNYDSDEAGIVDKIVFGYNLNNYFFVKVKVVNIRVPELGDKFSSRHGQKGTCGMLFNQEDMPFNGDPRSAPTLDMMVNPLAIPSRMTIGHLIECLMGKKCVVSCPKSSNDDQHSFESSEERTKGDATPFGKATVEQIGKELHKMGYNSMGYDTFYDGRTGEKLTALVFTGPTYYQRLRHMVVDKWHARSRGPNQHLTRQPKEGRANDGGLRIGEMERDCLIGQGVSFATKDRLMDQSDKFSCYVCRVCGMYANYDDYLKKAKCKPCGSDKIVKITLPYATKLLFQELIATNIIPRILFDEKGEIKVGV